MSSTLNEIAFSLLNELRGGRSSHNEHISLEQIKYNVKYYRAMFIRRDLDRNHSRFRMFEQDLGHVDLESVDSAESDSVTSNVTITRTSNDIPKPIRLKRSQGITHISSKDKVGTPIPLLDIQRHPWQQFNKYSSESAYASYRNRRIYIFNNEELESVNIRGVFEDPEDVFNFTKDDELDIYTGDEPFPISTDMIQGIKNGLLNEELKLIAGTTSDVETDTLQDRPQQQQQ